MTRRDVLMQRALAHGLAFREMATAKGYEMPEWWSTLAPLTREERDAVRAAAKGAGR